MGWASGQTNNYVYVSDSPLDARDPTGMFLDGGLAGGLAGMLGNGFASCTAGCGFWNRNAMINGFVGGFAGGMIAKFNPYIGGALGAALAEAMNQGANPFKPGTWDAIDMRTVGISGLLDGIFGLVNPGARSDGLNTAVNQALSIGVGAGGGNVVGVASGGLGCPK